MDVTLAVTATIILRVLMFVSAVVLIGYARDFLGEKKYVKGSLLLVIAAVLILVKINLVALT